MFQNAASFPGIARGAHKRLVVTDIMQKSGIEVDEEGSVAYAATGMQPKPTWQFCKYIKKWSARETA